MFGQSRPAAHRILFTWLLAGAAVIVGTLVFGLTRQAEPDRGDRDDRGDRGDKVSIAPAKRSPALSALLKPTPNSDGDQSRELQISEATSMSAIETILSNSELSSAQKAQSLLDAMGDLTGPPAVAACEQALVRLDSESYQPAFAKLVDAGVEMEIRQSIMADLMDRSDFLRLPLLVRLASLPEHPFCEEARTELIAVLGDDYGTNWLGWSDGVATYLESVSGVTGATVLE